MDYTNKVVHGQTFIDLAQDPLSEFDESPEAPEFCCGVKLKVKQNSRV